VDEILADVRFGDRREVAAGGTLEVPEFRDLDPRRRAADDVALRLDLRQRRVDRAGGDDLSGAVRLVGEPRDAAHDDGGNEHEKRAIARRLLAGLYGSLSSSSSGGGGGGGGVHSLACHVF